MQLGLGPILEKIKPLRAMLEKVVQLAKGRLPESLRPAAQNWLIVPGKRAPNAVANAPANATPTLTPTAGGDIPAPPEDVDAAATSPAGARRTEVQQEFDQQLANLLTADGDEVAMELEVAHARSDMRREAQPIFAELDQARERFIAELHELEEGQDPAPLIQTSCRPRCRYCDSASAAGRARVVNTVLLRLPR